MDTFFRHYFCDCTDVVQEFYFEMIKIKPMFVRTHVMLYTDADKLIVDYCFKLFT